MSSPLFPHGLVLEASSGFLARRRSPIAYADVYRLINRSPEIGEDRHVIVFDKYNHQAAAPFTLDGALSPMYHPGSARLARPSLALMECRAALTLRWKRREALGRFLSSLQASNLPRLQIFLRQLAVNNTIAFVASKLGNSAILCRGSFRKQEKQIILSLPQL